MSFSKGLPITKVLPLYGELRKNKKQKCIFLQLAIIMFFISFENTLEKTLLNMLLKF